MIQSIFQIIFVNLLALALNVLIAFLMPKFLSVETFSQIKLFQFYLTFVGIFHLGFTDGMKILFGGHEIREEPSKRASVFAGTMRVLQTGGMLILLLAAILQKNILCVCCALAVLPFNMINYFSVFFQATGKFQIYNLLTKTNAILTTALILTLLLIFHGDRGTMPFILGYLAIYYAIWICAESLFEKTIHLRCLFGRFRWSFFRHVVQIGLPVMLANLMTLLLSTIDRWFVHWFLSERDFAYYSFAASLYMLASPVVSALSAVFFRFFCQKPNGEKRRIVLSCTVFAAALLIAGTFCAEWIVEHFIGRYRPSIPVMFLLMAANFFHIITVCIMINLYQTERKQSLYFRRLMWCVTAAFCFNLIVRLFHCSIVGFASATLAAEMVTFVCCMWDFRKLFTRKIIYMTVIIPALFLYCGSYCSPLTGGFVYLLVAFSVWIVLEGSTLLRGRLFFDRLLRRGKHSGIFF